jgi:hypothetical protein
MEIKKGRHLITDGMEVKEVTINRVTETCFMVNGQWVNKQEFLSVYKVLEKIRKYPKFIRKIMYRS